MKDLYRLPKKQPEFSPEPAFVADKVVGKAAAALLIPGGVKRLFADVVSQPGREFYDRAEVPVAYTCAVQHRPDRCPFKGGASIRLRPMNAAAIEIFIG